MCEECGTSLKTSTYHLITSPDPSKPGMFDTKMECFVVLFFGTTRGLSVV